MCHPVCTNEAIGIGKSGNRPEKEQGDVGLAHEALDLAAVRRIPALLLFNTAFSITSKSSVPIKLNKVFETKMYRLLHLIKDRVTRHLDSYLLLTSEQKWCFSLDSIY